MQAQGRFDPGSTNPQKSQRSILSCRETQGCANHWAETGKRLRRSSQEIIQTPKVLTNASPGSFRPWVNKPAKVATLKALANAFSVQSCHVAKPRVVPTTGLKLANAFGVQVTTSF